MHTAPMTDLDPCGAPDMGAPVPDCATGPFGRLSWSFHEVIDIVRRLRRPTATSGRRSTGEQSKPGSTDPGMDSPGIGSQGP